MAAVRERRSRTRLHAFIVLDLASGVWASSALQSRRPLPCFAIALPCFAIDGRDVARKNERKDNATADDREADTTKCRKMKQPKKHLGPGLLIFSCEHGITMLMMVLQEHESEAAVFNLIMTRFQKGAPISDAPTKRAHVPLGSYNDWSLISPIRFDFDSTQHPVS